MVMPAAARSRFASVIARSTSPLPICPVGGVNVACSPEPVRVTCEPLRSPSRRLVAFDPEVEVLCAVVVPAALPFAALALVVAVLTVLLSPTMLLFPVITVPPVR